MAERGGVGGDDIRLTWKSPAAGDAPQRDFLLAQLHEAREDTDRLQVELEDAMSARAKLEDEVADLRRQLSALEKVSLRTASVEEALISERELREELEERLSVFDTSADDDNSEDPAEQLAVERARRVELERQVAAAGEEVVAARGLRDDHESLRAALDQERHSNELLQQEVDRLSTQARLWQAEVHRVRAQSEQLIAEMNQFAPKEERRGRFRR
jgi:chromosome segregation ATPase